MFEVIAFVIAIYCILILYLRLSDNGNGKRKNIAGWLLFGLMWPKIRQQLENDLKHGDKIVFILVLIFLIAAFVFTYLITQSTVLRENGFF